MTPYALQAYTIDQAMRHCCGFACSPQATGEAVWEMPSVLAWKKMSTQKVFYYNQATGASQRDRPAEMGFFDEEHGRTYWVDKDGNPTWESEHWWTE
eukprot:3137534-Pyramimonas_sp.AAC.4